MASFTKAGTISESFRRTAPGGRLYIEKVISSKKLLISHLFTCQRKWVNCENTAHAIAKTHINALVVNKINLLVCTSRAKRLSRLRITKQCIDMVFELISFQRRFHRRQIRRRSRGRTLRTFVNNLAYRVAIKGF